MLHTHAKLEWKIILKKKEFKWKKNVSKKGNLGYPCLL